MRAALERIVEAALAEDAPWGDVTTEMLLPETANLTARLVAREDGVLAGGDAFETAMRRTGAAASLHRADGERFTAGEVLATASGSARAVLLAERVGLNLVQRLSGIATETARYVDAVSHTRARIADTRKTTPGLRILERHAVRCGGGHNHRFSLSDAVLVKDNHLAMLGARSDDEITSALLALRARLPHTMHLEVEVDRIEQIAPVLAAGVDTIMLDNFGLDELREGVALIAGRALVEASGTVRLDTVTAIAETGVDVISVGALTHSVRSLDLGLDVRVDPVNDVGGAASA